MHEAAQVIWICGFFTALLGIAISWKLRSVAGVLICSVAMSTNLLFFLSSMLGVL